MTADLLTIHNALNDLWANYKITPNTIYIRNGDYMRMVKCTLTKRQYRRWRGKHRASMRRYARDNA